MIRVGAAFVQILALAFGSLLPVAPASAQVVVSPTAHMALKSYTMTLVGTAPTNGDNDGYADADETLNLTLTLINKSGKDLTDVTVTLVTYSTTIACIGTNQVVVPNVLSGATFTTPPLQFRVADASTVNRSDIEQAIKATFDVRIQADEFLALDTPLGFTLPLDLNATGGSGTSAYIESFEVGGANFGKFTLSTLDAGKNSLELSDGMRCQYNDPDGPNSYSPNRPDCFLGFPADSPTGINDWHVHDNGFTTGGGLARAYTGSKSLHWGVHNTPTPARDTVRFRQLDAVKSIAINLPLANVAPELVFAHQVSMVDNRITGTVDFGTSADRAVVEVNVLTAGGVETVWKKLYPYANEYDADGTHQFENCAFDPTDDGNNEDSFFDPSDPDRVFGPSSTCYPERVFACAGDTDYHHVAAPTNVCRAKDGPGLTGSIDIGTWVQPRFNLQEFAGRRIKIRFLATSLELYSSQTWDTGYFFRDDVLDDGWYIDDVRVNQALGLPMTPTADTKTVTPLPCAPCQSITASLTATPEVTPAPGSPVTLDAGGSIVNVCPTSPPTYQFWIDANANGIAGDAGDTLVRDFAEEPTFAFTPEDSHQYAVLVRCPSAPSCDAVDGSDTAIASSAVTCPPGISYGEFPQIIHVEWNFPGGIHWAVADSVDVIRGILSDTANPLTTTVRGGGSFTGTVVECLFQPAHPTNSVSDYSYPQPGVTFYFLVRGSTASTTCAAPPGYTTNASTERPGRDTELATDPEACP